MVQLILQPSSSGITYARTPVVYKYEGCDPTLYYTFNLFINNNQYVSIERKVDTYNNIIIDCSYSLQTYIRENFKYDDNNVIYFTTTLDEYSGLTLINTYSGDTAIGVYGYYVSNSVYVIPTTTTTTTTTPITTTTTTICQRPSGLTEYGFFGVIKPATGSTWTAFTSSLTDACNARTLFLSGGYDMAGGTGQVQKLEVGQKVWNGISTDCTYFGIEYAVVQSGSSYLICHIGSGGILDGVDMSCATTTTTTTINYLKSVYIARPDDSHTSEGLCGDIYYLYARSGTNNHIYYSGSTIPPSNGTYLYTDSGLTTHFYPDGYYSDWVMTDGGSMVDYYNVTINTSGQYISGSTCP